MKRVLLSAQSALFIKMTDDDKDKNRHDQDDDGDGDDNVDDGDDNGGDDDCLGVKSYLFNQMVIMRSIMMMSKQMLETK